MAGIKVQDDGSLGYDYSWWQSTFNPDEIALQQYVYETNLANERYNQEWNQYLTESQFNMDLAERQQALSEESYYNGVTNEARQLASLGINPAASGSDLSGATMQGGSNVAQQDPQAQQGQRQSARNSLSDMMGILSLFTNVAGTIGNINLQNKQGDLAEAQAGNLDSVTRLNEANATAQEIDNDVKRGNLETLRNLGLSENEWDSLRGLQINFTQANSALKSVGANIDLSATLFGVGASAGASVGSSAGSHTGSSSSIDGATLFYLIKQAKPDLTTGQIFNVMLNASVGAPDVDDIKESLDNPVVADSDTIEEVLSSDFFRKMQSSVGGGKGRAW